MMILTVLVDLDSIKQPKSPYAYKLSSKYDGWCKECNAAFKAGEVIYWNPRTKETFCESCGKELN